MNSIGPMQPSPCPNPSGNGLGLNLRSKDVTQPASPVTLRRAARFDERLGESKIGSITADYTRGDPVYVVARRHGVGPRALSRLLLRHGHVVRCAASYGRIGCPDHSFFDRINCEESAYVLGFVSADGWIDTQRGTVSIELAERDVRHLARIRDILAPGLPLRPHSVRCHGREWRQFRLTVTSRAMVAALGALGVGAAKSRTIQPCEQVPSHLLAAYWRGVFDGDGSIVRRRGRHAGSPADWMLELTGSTGICEGFRYFLLANGVSTSATLLPAGGVARFGVGGLRVAQAAASLLYRGAGIALGRKLALALELLEQPGRFDAGERLTRASIQAAILSNRTLHEAAAALGVGYTRLWRARRDLGMIGW